MVLAAFALGIFAGAVLAPACLPWIPGKAFAVKGSVAGLIVGIGALLILQGNISMLEALSLILVILSISSYLTMNFTGSTPYTSPSGVEKEMRIAIPFQATAVLLATVGWIGSAFI